MHVETILVLHIWLQNFQGCVCQWVLRISEIIILGFWTLKLDPEQPLFRAICLERSFLVCLHQNSKETPRLISFALFYFCPERYWEGPSFTVSCRASKMHSIILMLDWNDQFLFPTSGFLVTLMTLDPTLPSESTSSPGEEWLSSRRFS